MLAHLPPRFPYTAAQNPSRTRGGAQNWGGEDFFKSTDPNDVVLDGNLSPFEGAYSNDTYEKEIADSGFKLYGYTPEEYDRLQEFSMRNARSKAVRVAFEAAGKSVESKVNGIFVTRVDQSSNFRDKLKVGDLIETIDGKRLTNTEESLEELQEYLSSLEPGHYLSLMIKRDGESKLVRDKLKLNSRTGRIRLGFDGEIDEDVTSDPSIEFDPHGVSGPSGGLMFTLEIYNQITNSHLKKGHNIAGTGTIELDGRVGRIGGIDKKLVAAIEAGATVFLAPDDEITDEMRERYPDIKTNYEEVKEAAEKLGTDIKIYPVKTLQEAIEILKNL